jgi:hypothetical protein
MLVDKNLKDLRYPIEFPRKQRSFLDLKYFKASDYRNLIFYAAVPGLCGILHDSGYQHLILYVLYIRLLTQEIISDNDLQSASIIFSEFHEHFAKLHGEDFMTYKLHAHNHFINQVKRFGPLHKISCFPFEGMFKICADLYHGTRSHLSQINRSLEMTQSISSETQELLEITIDDRLRAFLGNEFNKKQKNDDLCYKTILNLNDLDNEVLFLINTLFKNSLVDTSSRATIKKKSQYFFFYFILMIN